MLVGGLIGSVLTRSRCLQALLMTQRTVSGGRICLLPSTNAVAVTTIVWSQANVHRTMIVVQHIFVFGVSALVIVDLIIFLISAEAVEH